MGETVSSIILTKQLEEKYLASLMMEGRKSQTIRVYRRCLSELYDYLPKGKKITQEKLEEWKAYLKESGYSDSSINIRLTVANGLLKFSGLKEYAVSHKRIEIDEDPPKLTRAEYLQFLSAVREYGTEQDYLLIKVFATIGIGIHELQYLTVEVCRDGVLHLPDGRTGIVPTCLGEELNNYARRRDITSGSIFVTRSGNQLDRSNIARSIRSLAIEAGMEPEKCSPRALQRVYRTTQKELREKLIPIYRQTYDNLLNTEQAIVAWEGGVIQ